MAFYSGSQTNAAGSLLTILDVVLPYNTYWSIYDTPATNERVYECSYPGGEFYLYVNDNQAGYATVAIYEGWDAVSHIGVGIDTTGITLYWRKTTGAYWVILSDERVIYVCFGTGVNYGHFAGNVDRYCPEQNTPLLVATRGTTVTGVPPLAYCGTSSTSYWGRGINTTEQFVFNCACEWAMDDGPGVPASQGFVYKTSGGSNRVLVEETVLVMVGSPRWAIGVLRGVVAMGNVDTMVHGDTVTVGGVTWEYVASTAGCLLKKA